MGVDRWKAKRRQRVTMRMELQGAKELEEALRELPKRLAKGAIRRALLKALEPIAEDARARVHRLRGFILRAIGVSTVLSRRQRKQRSTMKGDIEAYVGAAPARHAHLLEFGTGPRQTKDGKSTGQARAFPFLRPAWESGKAAALALFAKLLWAEIERAATRLRKRQEKALKKLDF